MSPQAERFRRRPATFPLQQVFNRMNSSATRRKDLTALDLGCGFGRDTYKLVVQGHETIGIDRNAEALEAAQNRHQQSPFGLSKVNFVEADIRDMPAFDTRFSLVTTANTLHYMPKADQYEVITEMQRLTGYIGRCVISTLRKHDAADARRQARAFEPDELREMFSNEEWQVLALYDMVPEGNNEPVVNLIANRIK